MSKPTTLIVGCGYLGRRVAARLTHHDRVFGTCRSNARAAELTALGVEPIVADVLQPETGPAGLPTVDRVLYCVGFDRAAGVPMRTVDVELKTFEFPDSSARPLWPLRVRERDERLRPGRRRLGHGGRSGRTDDRIRGAADAGAARERVGLRRIMN